ncbi:MULTISPECIES: hypothetical protein [Amycolatopsis]|uniref:hypothetical protein n=1 Tax=Amycolatopsis TaxID=1813 RepID=UPI000B8B3C0B|nr:MULTISPECIES: hypothetical protein [Amycolatopsis]OXM72679.1 hypothetical protein CF166_13765 [Amycolatopsis sp. KNN50.9b]
MLAQVLVAYSTIIEEARRGLVDLMTACADGFAQVSKQVEAAGLSVGITEHLRHPGLERLHAVVGGVQTPPTMS